jgi:hypothetical protein
MAVRGGGSPFGYVADTYAIETNVVFGPAAWNRGTGPASTAALLEVGDWSVNPECDPLPADVSPFPGTIRLRNGANAAYAHLEGARFDDLDSFLRVVSNLGDARPLKVATFEERLAAVQEVF